MPETLLTHRCPCCTATMTAPDADPLPQCEMCGHGTTRYEVTIQEVTNAGD
jgi:hypothetical protein